MSAPTPPLRSRYSSTDPLAQPLRGATMGEAYARFWRKYGMFDGRASRSEFWWASLANAFVALAVGAIAVALGAGVAPSVGVVVAGLYALATLVPSFALINRRLHDTGRSGWWQLLAFVPFGGIAIVVLAALPETSEGARYDIL